MNLNPRGRTTTRLSKFVSLPFQVSNVRIIVLEDVVKLTRIHTAYFSKSSDLIISQSTDFSQIKLEIEINTCLK